jgi:hypothetical protein
MMTESQLRALLGRMSSHLDRQLDTEHADRQILAERTAAALAALADGHGPVEVARILGCLDCPCDHRDQGTGPQACPHCGCVCPAPDPDECAGNPDACPCCGQDTAPWNTDVVHEVDAPGDAEWISAHLPELQAAMGDPRRLEQVIGRIIAESEHPDVTREALGLALAQFRERHGLAVPAGVGTVDGREVAHGLLLALLGEQGGTATVDLARLTAAMGDPDGRMWSVAIEADGPTRARLTVVRVGRDDDGTAH